MTEHPDSDTVKILTEPSQGTATAPRRRRGPGRPFVKGQIANPGGRPKSEVNIRALARTYAPEAIAGLYEIATTQRYPPAARVGAWRELLDRGYGRPPQAITGEDGAPLLPRVVIHRLEMGEVVVAAVTAIDQNLKENAMLPPSGES